MFEKKRRIKRKYVDIKAVKRLMAEKGLDIKKLAALMKISLPAIKRVFSIDNHYLRYCVIFLLRISHALRVPFRTIMPENNKSRRREIFLLIRKACIPPQNINAPTDGLIDKTT